MKTTVPLQKKYSLEDVVDMMLNEKITSYDGREDWAKPFRNLFFLSMIHEMKCTLTDLYQGPIKIVQFMEEGIPRNSALNTLCWCYFIMWYILSQTQMHMIRYYINTLFIILTWSKVQDLSPYKLTNLHFMTINPAL